MRAADVAAIYDLLNEEFANVDLLRERLREIVAPGQPPIPIVAVPRLD